MTAKRYRVQGIGAPAVPLNEIDEQPPSEESEECEECGALIENYEPWKTLCLDCWKAQH
jgi:hypothetical protein